MRRLTDWIKNTIKKRSISVQQLPTDKSRLTVENELSTPRNSFGVNLRTNLTMDWVTPADRTKFEELMKLAGAHIYPEVSALLLATPQDKRSLLVHGKPYPTGRNFKDALDRSLQSRGGIASQYACFCGLVCRDENGSIVGAALAGPPIQLLQNLRSNVRFQNVQAVAVRQVLRGLVKFYGAAVEPDRQGEGIGTALIEAMRLVYASIGFRWMYGQFIPGPQEPRHEKLYRGLDFKVLQVDEPLPLAPFFRGETLANSQAIEIAKLSSSVGLSRERLIYDDNLVRFRSGQK